MRTIKFRAWDEKNKVMLDEIDFSQSSIYWSKWFGARDVPLMQFTGLLDKNGKDIFEGDIIKANLPYGKLFIVHWSTGRASFMLKGATTSDFAAYDREGYKMNASKKLEIIGNIYENPDLLTPKQ